jgi:hypothetical protein
MKHSSILCCLGLAIAFLSGCANYTMPQYANELRYETKKLLRTNLAKEGSWAKCFDIDTDSMVRKFHQKLMECVSSERRNRPYEFSAISAMAYGKADAECANTKFGLEHADSIDLNNIPSKHISFCKELKLKYTE